MTRDLLFEIGVEEMPSEYMPDALDQLRTRIGATLRDQRLAFEGDVRVYGAPRRLAAYVTGLAERQPDLTEDVLGPATKVAFDASGQPTKALIGFCAGKGVDVSTVKRVETPKGEYVSVTVHSKGKPALEVLPALLAGVATKLAFPKSMRWLDDDTRYARPVRWLLALLGDTIVPVKCFRLEAGRATYGHRFLAPARIELKQASEYVATLEKASVMVDPAARRNRIVTQIEALAAKSGGRIWKDEKFEELLTINTFLVEWPTAFVGTFDPKYTSALPIEVLVTAMREHQRFFAVEHAREARALLPCFIAIRNGAEQGLDLVRKGNCDVLVARLDDALFYWETDLKKTPADRVDALSGVVWMEGLGSLREKATRLEGLGAWVAQRLAPADETAVARAALLCKTDLLTEMIGSGKEYADLQGIMGAYYAAKAGEPEAVQQAIYGHYAPRGSGDAVPTTSAAACLSLADKLDHVAGAFVAGKVPSGSEDPYGVRRAGNGVVRILREKAFRLDLRAACMESTRPFFAANSDLPQAEIMKQLGDFWRARVATSVAGGEADGAEVFAPDTVEAAMEAKSSGRRGWQDPYDCLLRTRALNQYRDDAHYVPLVILFKRVSNILAKNAEALPPAVDAALLKEKVERDLAEALTHARQATEALWEKCEYARILPALLGMDAAIHAFFEGVMVNAEDPAVRLNRLRLLADVRELFLRGWDLSKVVVEGEKPSVS